MFKNKFMKILGSCLFLLILCFSLTSYVYADDGNQDINDENLDPAVAVPILGTVSDDDGDNISGNDSKEDLQRQDIVPVNTASPDAGGGDNSENSGVSAGMKNTGLPYFLLVLLFLLSFIGLNIKRKF